MNDTSSVGSWIITIAGLIVVITCAYIGFFKKD
jgi:hypothetical protein